MEQSQNLLKEKINKLNENFASLRIPKQTGEKSMGEKETHVIL